MSWEEGYVTDTPYTYGYYGEMAPSRVDYGLALAGFDALPPGPCCELGFGQGVTMNMSAAADPTRRWWGNDFNPAQARFAQRMTLAAETNVTISDQSFAEFCARQDLPDFSLITLHGVWSWISRDNQRVILDFIKRKLALGGVLYVSYNTAPGWSAIAPVRTLFAEHARAMAGPAMSSAERMQEAIEFVARVLDTNPQYLKMNPAIKPRLEAMRKHSASYLPHEYLNAEWNLTSFGEMARSLDSAKLSFVGNAGLLERIEALHLDEAQRGLLEESRDLALRETLREFMTDTPFRRDYWIKGGRRLPARRHSEVMQEQLYVLATLPEKVPKEIKCTRGKWDLNPEVYGPLLALLHEQRDPISRADLADRFTRENKFGSKSFDQALTILVAIGAVQPARTRDARGGAQTTCSRLNAHILSESADEFRVGHLASPITGLGISIDFVTQLMMQARHQGLQAPGQVAAYVQDAMRSQGQSLRVDGRTIDDPTESAAQLVTLFSEFEQQFVPLLTRLGLV